MRTRLTHHAPEELSSAQETLLRVTLHEHAPQQLDLEHDWQAISQRLAPFQEESKQASPVRQFVRPATLQTQRNRMWWTLPVAVAAALVLALLGAGIAGLFFGGEGAHVVYAYTNIAQSQQANDITITLTKGYADPSRLAIGYTLNLSPSLKQRYSLAFASGKASNQYLQKNSRNIGAVACKSPQQHGWPVPCSDMRVTGPTEPPLFRVPANVNTLELTWDVTQVSLCKHVSGQQTCVSIPGHWHFHVTLPFSHQSHDPGKPFPQN